MNKKVIISIIILTLSYCFSYAQLKEGKITTTNGVPIPNVNIVIKESLISTFTDNNGKYSIDLDKGTHEIILLAEGYETATKIVQCNAASCSLGFTLKKDLQELKTIVLQENRHGKKILNTKASISEISSKAIKETQTQQLRDLNSLIPNYVYSDLGVSYQQQITLRGVSAFSEVPSVTTYIDGINTFNISANNLLLSDIENISVYRGPQGALFAQDAIGGIINIVTQKPSNKHTAFIETSIGNQGFNSYAGGFKIPLIKNKLFIGGNGKFQAQHGFNKNNLTGTFSFDGTNLEESPENGVRVGDKQAIYGNVDIKYIANEKLDFLFNFKQQVDRSIGASSLYQAALTPERALENPDEFSVNALGSDYRNVLNTYLKTQYKSTNYLIKNTSYFSKVKIGYDNIDGDITPFDFYTASSSYNGKLGEPFPLQTIGHDFKIESTAKKTWSWLAGGSIFYQDYKRQYSYTSNTLNQEYKDFQKNTGISGFGQVSYKPSRKFHMDLHIRYDTETKNTTASVTDTNNENQTEIIESIERKRNFSALNPKFVFGYNPANNHQLYLSYARGFKSGGINNRITGENEFSIFDSEYSNVFETGYKWLSYDNKYLFAITAYGMYWQNMQLYYFAQEVDRLDIGGIWVIDNIGDVTSYGLEAEITAKPYSGLEINATLGMNKGQYNGFEFLGTNLKNNTTILSPEFTSFVGVQQAFSVSKKQQISGIIRGEWRVIGNQYFDLVNTIKQSTYQIFNARLSLLAKKNVSLVFGIKNIFNKRYIAFSLPGQFKATILNRPRNYNISLIYNFKK